MAFQADIMGPMGGLGKRKGFDKRVWGLGVSGLAGTSSGLVLRA